MTIDLIIPLPSINNYWKPRIIRGVYNGMYLTQAGHGFKNALGMIAKTAVNECTENPIILTINFRVKNINKDIDNMLKPVLDALEGIVYKNDRQIVQLHVFKHIGKNDCLSIDWEVL